MTAPDRFVMRRHLRAAGIITLLTALAACGTVTPHQDAVQESARYAAHAKHNYAPPGPAEDPWGPYIREASARFDIPDTWVRALMRVESGGKEFLNGQLITSGAGAMGLMQVMPGTYDELRDRYNLGDDPFDPHDNIMAGVAYMREMYELYGSPGFLAAYNAGPARLDDYLANVRPLPDETRHYVAMIGPNLRGVYPNNRSAADEMAMNTLPINIPPGKRYGRPVMLASARPVVVVACRAAHRWRSRSCLIRRGTAGPPRLSSLPWSRRRPCHRCLRMAASGSSPRPMRLTRRRLGMVRSRLVNGRSRSVLSPTRDRRTARWQWRRTTPMWNSLWRIRMSRAFTRDATSCGGRG